MKAVNKKIRILVITILGFIALIYLLEVHIKYRYYKSNEVMSGLTHWGVNLDAYHHQLHKVPNLDEFLEFCKNDTLVIKYYGNIISDKINVNDFFISSDDSCYYVYVWLFKEGDENRAILYDNMNYFDFLLKRSVLVSKSPLSE